MEATAAVSCCRSDEAVSAAGGITMLGVVGAVGAVCGANQPSCGDEFASIALAASPYDCQAKVAPIPIENMIRKRARPREALWPSDGPIAPTDEPSIGSRPGRARSGWSAATSGWCAAFRKRPPTLGSSPSTSVGLWPVRSSKCPTVNSAGSLGGGGVTVESISTPTCRLLTTGQDLPPITARGEADQAPPFVVLASWLLGSAKFVCLHRQKPATFAQMPLSVYR